MKLVKSMQLQSFVLTQSIIDLLAFEPFVCHATQQINIQTQQQWIEMEKKKKNAKLYCGTWSARSCFFIYYNCLFSLFLVVFFCICLCWWFYECFVSIFFIRLALKDLFKFKTKTKMEKYCIVNSHLRHTYIFVGCHHGNVQ